jgi:hypothetical protein
MRTTHPQRELLRQELLGHWPELAEDLTPQLLIDVELGLSISERLMPEAEASALWVLLTGYRPVVLYTSHWSHDDQQVAANARFLLGTYASPYAWTMALDAYCRIPQRLRGYDMSSDRTTYARREPGVAADRWNTYTILATTPRPHQRTTLRWAKAGTYRCLDGTESTSVAIPATIIAPHPTGHNLNGISQRNTITIDWEHDLVVTGRWINETLVAQGITGRDWEADIRRIELALFDEKGAALTRSSMLMLDRVVHLIGMVSSGKSTLMDVLAVWAARKGYHLTLVVGDVVAAVDRAAFFRSLGLRVAPILGASNRERHTSRLHRLQAEQSIARLDIPLHPGFRWLSTACGLNAQRQHRWTAAMPDPPCRTLRDGNDNLFLCPAYGSCQRHQAQRDLVDAQIWIATPASLIYSRIDAQLNPERLRFAELVYRRSDLIIVDEVDQVQGQLDLMFNPSQTLAGRGDTWLNFLGRQVEPELARHGHGQLRDPMVLTWWQAYQNARSATGHLYALLLKEPELRAWLTRDYFTNFLLCKRFVTSLYSITENLPSNMEQAPMTVRAESLRLLLEQHCEDPLGEGVDDEPELRVLAELARSTLTHGASARLRTRLNAWVTTQLAPEIALNTAELEHQTTRLLAILLVSILSAQIDLLLRHWRPVEGIFHLEAGRGMLSHQAPQDYNAVIPAAPMGNILGFQYLPPSDNDAEAGELRFFRCMGIGRWMLGHFHELWQADGLAGPHTLLLSGTSWAGTSSRYHVQVPVTGILRAPQEELDAIARSRCRLLTFDNKVGEPIRVSSRNGPARVAALQDLVTALALQRSVLLRTPSKVEQIRNELDPDRRRVLLLVGSYAEARIVYDHLYQLRPDWRGQMRYLVPDDETMASDWSDSGSLTRGRVHHLADTGAWLLVAPLMAVERGHNILNETRRAAIGAALFLVRPHPRPDDIGHAIHAINAWAVEEAGKPAPQGISIDMYGQQFRRRAFERWRALLNVPIRYSTLEAADREALIWTQLVSIWQVIGRLVRGGCDAQVYFCDAAFAPLSARRGDERDQIADSLLIGMRSVLRRYCDSGIGIEVSTRERTLVRALYEPFYRALRATEGLPDADDV